MLEAFQLLVSQVAADLLRFTTWAGVADAIGTFSVLFPAGMAMLWILQAAHFIYSREWRLPFSRDIQLTVAAVVPAHNEELVIEETLKHLLAQDYPHLKIHVVSDGSSDQTVALARQYEDRGVVVHDLQPNRGKSGVLEHALKEVDTDLFLIVDADTQADPQAVSYLVQQFADPEIAAVTGGIRVANTTSFLTALQAMEYTVIVSLAKRAEQFWGVLNTVSGAAACFRTDVLRQAGGWASHTATEDIEMSWRLQSMGWRVAYEVRSIFYVRAPETLRGLFRQRQRWAEGMTEVVGRSKLMQGRTFRMFPMLFTTLATAVWSLCVLIGLSRLLISLATSSGSGPGLSWESAGLLESLRILYWSLGLFILQALLACAVESHYTRGVLRWFPVSVLYPFYYWLIIFPSFLSGTLRALFAENATRWTRTERSAATEVAVSSE